jgi:hypothetical protein
MAGRGIDLLQGFGNRRRRDHVHVRPASQLGLGEAAPNGEEDRRWRWTQPVVDAGWELRGAKTIEMLDLHEDLMGI